MHQPLWLTMQCSRAAMYTRKALTLYWKEKQPAQSLPVAKTQQHMACLLLHCVEEATFWTHHASQLAVLLQQVQPLTMQQSSNIRPASCCTVLSRQPTYHSCKLNTRCHWQKQSASIPVDCRSSRTAEHGLQLLCSIKQDPSYQNLQADQGLCRQQ